MSGQPHGMRREIRYKYGWGMSQALETLGESVRPFDMVLYGASAALEVLGHTLSPKELEDKWGNIFGGVITNTDPCEFLLNFSSMLRGGR